MRQSLDILSYPFDPALILQKKRSIKKQLAENPGLIDKKIAIVGGSTIGEFKNILEIFLLNLGIRPEFHEGGYGLFYENVVFDDGSLAAFKPDILYIHTSSRNIRHWPEPSDTKEHVEEKFGAETRHFETLWNAAQKLGCPVVQNNFELPPWRNFGNLDASDTRGRVNYVSRLNQKMSDRAAAVSGFYVHDLEYLSASYGLDSWCDSATWYAYKYACAVSCIPVFCHSLASLMGSLFGRTKKAVVADLDNTLWGGVIGETGAEGIELGDETPAGMMYAEFQSYLKMLSMRGILLNVASKNEEAPARSGFEREDSPLKNTDFLCFEANWNPKSLSIEKIAKTLNILPDSMVFIDDNPAERELVSQELPEVAVLPINQPEDSIRLLDRSGYFECAAVSDDDIKRGDMYRQNAQRVELEQSFGNYEDYLRSLDMSANIHPFAAAHVERITQLINKTNQFNLTTRRYTTAEVEQRMNSKEYITLSGKLVDKFGDNGITSVIIGRVEGDVLDIELWIMSCRVFKRHFEYAMFDQLVNLAAKHGIHSIKGCWMPTAKNLLVKDYYATIGFELEEDTEEKRVFRFDIPKEYVNLNNVITIKTGE